MYPKLFSMPYIFFFSFEIVLGSQAGLKLRAHSQAGLELISLALLPGCWEHWQAPTCLKAHDFFFCHSIEKITNTSIYFLK